MVLRSLKRAVFKSPATRVALEQLARTFSNGRGRGVEPGSSSGLGSFKAWLGSVQTGTVLELGTRRVAGDPPTVRRTWVAPSVRYVACDYMSGLDVDAVVDAERLSKTFEAGSIDAVIACSVFEHIRRPWLAAEQIGKVLRPGGRVYVQTHQCYPIHAHPYDYWRFSREAMETLFAQEFGFKNQASWYEYPASILSERNPLAVAHEAFLNVNLVAEKDGENAAGHEPQPTRSA
ncbi:class I SAM-dependent methyltransferase [Bradyrhizobium sp. LHD-71]|uniref:class I SAM-dependent methyltransferase n=1 Tax=Bradyrhizobium sp. LHD-71 TaxID=3072141 RepID=UPI00281086A4|nr:class I SAM-dependent methyltransferase [Bradyrhizobium sp. LHD-71]MDQ8728369.1 class I SAM-dependent methyltransferase [Bradyrhizobium sp. LHD-71]